MPRGARVRRMNVALRRPMARDDFLLWVEGQEGRYEFDGFQPVAMTGGTNKHGKIARNLAAQLFFRLRGGRCRSMTAEGGGVATVGDVVRYPDATVTCSAIPDALRLVPDPVVVFEVLSPSSRHADLVEKPIEYGAVPSIRRYVIVEQDRVEVKGFARTPDGQWVATDPLRAGATLELPEIGIVLPLADIYEDVSVEA